jgi:hypothetical protein
MEFPNGNKGRAVYQGNEILYDIISYDFESLPGEEIFPPHENRARLGKSDRWFPLPEMLLHNIQFTEMIYGATIEESKNQKLLELIREVENITTSDIIDRYDDVKICVDRLLSLFDDYGQPPEFKERVDKSLESYLKALKEVLSQLEE